MSMLATIGGPLLLTLGFFGPNVRDEEYCPGCAARAEAREMLREADENGDGKLDLEELTALVLREEEEDEDEEGYEGEDEDEGMEGMDEEGEDDDEDEGDDEGDEDEESEEMSAPPAPSPAPASGSL